MLGKAMALEKSSKSKAVKIGCLGIVAAMAVAVLVRGAWATGYLPVRLFNSTEWKNPTEANSRISMINALLLTHTLKGMTRSEVIHLLGEPPASEYFRDWDFVYRLGNERGLFSIDSEWLVVKFGPDGKVAAWDVVRD